MDRVVIVQVVGVRNVEKAIANISASIYNDRGPTSDNVSDNVNDD
jgi:hypothetical protein